jgi:hypothetical protein
MKRLGKEKAHEAMTPKTRESVKRKEEVIKKLNQENLKNEKSNGIDCTR